MTAITSSAFTWPLQLTVVQLTDSHCTAAVALSEVHVTTPEQETLEQEMDVHKMLPSPRRYPFVTYRKVERL